MGGGDPAGSRDAHGMQHGMSAMEREVRAKVCGVPRCRGVLRASPQCSRVCTSAFSTAMIMGPGPKTFETLRSEVHSL